MNVDEFESKVKDIYLKFPSEKRNKIHLSVYKKDIQGSDFGYSDMKYPRRIVLIYSTFKKTGDFSENKILTTLNNLFDFKEEQSSKDAYMSSLGDSPFCSSCGHLTVRSATCFKCLNCGNSEGCS